MDTKRIRNVDISQIHHLPMIDFIGNDFAIFNDIKDMPLSSYPTRLNAACLTVCLKGWCKLELNLQQCEMREGMLGIIFPTRLFCNASVPMIFPVFSLLSQGILWIW